MADIQIGPNPESPKEPAVLEHELTNVEADEQAYEQLPESKETFLEQEPSATTTIAPQTRTATTTAVPPRRDEVVIHVEKIMEEGMGVLYASLPDDAKPLFRKKGEEVADVISDMIRRLKVEAAKVLRLIRDWLLTIPKVNRHFLEQEAKIKTDQIIEYASAHAEDMTKRP